MHARFRYLASVQKGRAPPPASASGIPYLTVEYLRGETDSPPLVETAPNSVVAALGEILLLWDGANAGEFLRAKRGVVSSTLALVSPNPKLLDRRFFFWACKAKEDHIKAHTVGMDIRHVNGDYLGNLSFFVPGLDQQRAIADHVEREMARLDGLAVASDRMASLLAEYRRSVIHYALREE